MLRTCPWPRASMPGRAAFMPLMTPWTLMSRIRCAVASLSSKNGPMGMIPALLTSTSSDPKRSSTAVRNARNEAGSVTSSANAATFGPSSAAASWPACGSTSPIATFIPSLTHSRAVSRPIPRAPPVIAITFPASIRGCLAISAPVRRGSWCATLAPGSASRALQGVEPSTPAARRLGAPSAPTRPDRPLRCRARCTLS